MRVRQIPESVSISGLVFTIASYIFDPLVILRLLYLAFVKVPLRTLRWADEAAIQWGDEAAVMPLAQHQELVEEARDE